MIDIKNYIIINYFENFDDEFFFEFFRFKTIAYNKHYDFNLLFVIKRLNCIMN